MGRMALSPAPSQEQFDRLLATLSADRAQAGERYEALRQKLIRFFAWEGLRDPAGWADEVLNRAALKLSEAAVIEKVDGYVHGIARFVLKEAQRAELRETSLGEGLEFEQSVVNAAEDERAAECLRSCLSQIPERTKDLILNFYEGDSQGRIRNRQKLAQRLGLNLNALRNRALRVRQNLEKCVFACLDRDVIASRRTLSDGME